MEKLPKTLPAFFLHFIKKQWVLFAIAQLLYFAWAFDQTVWPYLFKDLIDGINSIGEDRSNMWSLLTPLLITWGLFWIALEICYRLSGMLMARILPQFEADVRMAMFDYVQHHSYKYFTENLAGALANKISDMPNSMTIIMQQTMYLFMPVLLAIGIMTTFFLSMQPLFALILVGWVVIHLGICFGCAKRCSYYSDVRSEARSTLTGVIVDSFVNHANVRLFARYPFEKEYLERYQKIEQKANSRSLWFIEKLKFALGLTSLIVLGGINTWFMLFSWQKGYITTGEVVFVFNITWNVMTMVWIAGLELPKLFREIGVCQQALSVIKEANSVVDKPEARPLALTSGNIIFDKVSFHYNPNQNIFHDKSTVIKAGEKVGLVGFSGSGKTTFVNLILRNFDLQSGKILIDGQDISQVTQESLRKQIAMIPQDPALFHRTLMENIRYGRLDASDEEVVAAAKKAHCLEFITKLPQGFQTVVGERGAKLSGGQRQRIAIARAFLKNAPILILDEATSALDSVNERFIQEALMSLMHQKTTLVVAHRLSSLAGMDRILVFKDGKIIEEGTHFSLISKEGHYAHMWQMQAGGFLIDSKDEIF